MAVGFIGFSWVSTREKSLATGNSKNTAFSTPFKRFRVVSGRFSLFVRLFPRWWAALAQ
jgi:hypothetical protein